jgi:hypothetical protein
MKFAYHEIAPYRPRSFWNHVINRHMAVRVDDECREDMWVVHKHGNRNRGSRGANFVAYSGPVDLVCALRRYITPEHGDAIRECLERLLLRAEDTDPLIVRSLELTVPHAGARHVR